MRKSTIAEHIEDFWPIYGAAICIFAVLAIIVLAVEEGQRRAEVCFGRGMVVVLADTPAGAYCAAPAALERI
jgi:hypothetical protein